MIDLNNVEVRKSLALKVENEITSLQRRAQEEQLMLQEVIRNMNTLQAEAELRSP